MKPTQQEIIELARELRLIANPNESRIYQHERGKLFEAARMLERFGAGGGNPTGYLVGHSGEYHYFRHKADAEREKAEQERLSGEVCGDVEPLLRRSAIFF